MTSIPMTHAEAMTKNVGDHVIFAGLPEKKNLIVGKQYEILDIEDNPYVGGKIFTIRGEDGMLEEVHSDYFSSKQHMSKT